MYFSNFPKTYYELAPASYKKPAEYIVLTDITTNVRFKKEVIDKISVYDWYTMKDTQTIENVSEELYGSPHYHWVLMLLNDRYDYVNDFPITVNSLNRVIHDKYAKSVLVDDEEVTLLSRYGLDEKNMIIKTITAGGYEFDFTTTMWVIDKESSTPTNAITKVEHKISSVTYHDRELGFTFKRFFDHVTDDYVDYKVNKVYFGQEAAIQPVYAYNYEVELNDKKREIKVLSNALLQAVLKNFKDLM